MLVHFADIDFIEIFHDVLSRGFFGNIVHIPALLFRSFRLSLFCFEAASVDGTGDKMIVNP